MKDSSNSLKTEQKDEGKDRSLGPIPNAAFNLLIEQVLMGKKFDKRIRDVEIELIDRFRMRINKNNINSVLDKLVDKGILRLDGDKLVVAQDGIENAKTVVIDSSIASVQDIVSQNIFSASYSKGPQHSKIPLEDFLARLFAELSENVDGFREALEKALDANKEA